MLNPLTIGDNPQAPGITSEVYIPDQLIAGNLKLVTDNLAVITGGLLYQRGTVLGQILEAAAGVTAGTPAVGTLTFSGNPAVADSVTLNGTVVTFIANDTLATAGQVALGLTEAQTIEALLAYLTASTDTQLVKFKYSAAGQVITLTAVTGGTGGNALTTVATSSVIAAGAGTLAGGVNNTGNGTFGAITLGVGAQLGIYLLACIQSTAGAGPVTAVTPGEGNVGTGTFGAIAIAPPAQVGDYRVELTATGATAAFDVFDPHNELVGTGNVATAFSAGGIGFTLANGGTMTKGDTWYIAVTDNGVALFSVLDPHGFARPNVTVGTAYVDQIDFTLSQGATKFVVGDAFAISVAAGSGKYKPAVATATDGSQTPCAILADVADTTGGDVSGAVYQTGEFNANSLFFDPSFTIASLTGALRKFNIFVKTSISANNPE